MSQTRKGLAASPPRVTPSMQDCLEAILRLQREKGAARVRDLAQALSIHKSTVTAMLRQLSRRGLIRYRPYELAVLEPAGRAIAERVTGDHHQIRTFLQEILLLDADAAEANACRLEHAADRRLIERIDLFARYLHENPRRHQRVRSDFARFLERAHPRRWSPKRGEEEP